MAPLALVEVLVCPAGLSGCIAKPLFINHPPSYPRPDLSTRMVTNSCHPLAVWSWWWMDQLVSA